MSELLKSNRVISARRQTPYTLADLWDALFDHMLSLLTSRRRERLDGRNVWNAERDDSGHGGVRWNAVLESELACTAKVNSNDRWRAEA